MITISSSSHVSTKALNREAFSEVDELLLSQDNPLSELFQEETLFLDSTDGYVGIQYHTYIDLDDFAGMGKLRSFVNWLRKCVDVEGIYIGDYAFTR